MYKNNKIKYVNMKIIVLCIVVVVFLGISISVCFSRSNFFGEGIIKEIVVGINKVVMYPFTALNGEKNVDQSESYLIQKNVNTSLEKEIQELKDVLDLNRTLTEYTPINATILSRIIGLIKL